MAITLSKIPRAHHTVLTAQTFRQYMVDGSLMGTVLVDITRPKTKRIIFVPDQSEKIGRMALNHPSLFRNLGLRPQDRREVQITIENHIFVLRFLVTGTDEVLPEIIGRWPTDEQGDS